MAHVIELARFTVQEGAEAALVAERSGMVEALRRHFPGCVGAYLTRQDDGSWLDVIIWASRADAEEAARRIGSVPECASWLRHIDRSLGLTHAQVLHARTFPELITGQGSAPAEADGAG